MNAKALLLICFVFSWALQVAFAADEENPLLWRDGKIFSVSPDRKWKVVCHDNPAQGESENGYFLEESTTHQSIRLIDIPRALEGIVWKGDSSCLAVQYLANRNFSGLGIFKRQADGHWEELNDQDPKLQELNDAWNAQIPHMAFDQEGRLCLQYSLAEKYIKHGSDAPPPNNWIGVRRFKIEDDKVVYLDEKRLPRTYSDDEEDNKEIQDLWRLYAGGIFPLNIVSPSLSGVAPDHQLSVDRRMNQDFHLGYYADWPANSAGPIFLGDATVEDRVIAPSNYKDRGMSQGDGFVMLVVGKKGTQPRLYLGMEDRKMPKVAGEAKPLNQGVKAGNGWKFYNVGQKEKWSRVLSKAVDLAIPVSSSIILICDEPNETGTIKRSYWRVWLDENGPNLRMLRDETIDEKEAPSQRAARKAADILEDEAVAVRRKKYQEAKEEAEKDGKAWLKPLQGYWKLADPAGKEKWSMRIDGDLRFFISKTTGTSTVPYTGYLTPDQEHHIVAHDWSRPPSDGPDDEWRVELDADSLSLFVPARDKVVLKREK